jgi:hypothetical protein
VCDSFYGINNNNLIDNSIPFLILLKKKTCAQCCRSFVINDAHHVGGLEVEKGLKERAIGRENICKDLQVYSLLFGKQQLNNKRRAEEKHRSLSGISLEAIKKTTKKKRRRRVEIDGL